jgi:hypothetical protein
MKRVNLQKEKKKKGTNNKQTRDGPLPDVSLFFSTFLI